jgi:hypothetical protein
VNKRLFIANPLDDAAFGRVMNNVKNAKFLIETLLDQGIRKMAIFLF